jgi:hypothetical protein
MGLTRPKIWDLDTTIEYFKDPITVLHQGATTANVDVGFLFNRANGLVSNVAMVWQESTQSFVYVYTSSSGINDSNVVVTANASITVGNVLFVNGAGLYINGTLGAPGSVLGSNGTSLAWVAGGGFSGGGVANQTTFASNLVVANTTTSSSTTTGALVVTGGTGIAGNLYVGGNVVIGGAQYYTNTISSIGAGAVLLDSWAASVWRAGRYHLTITDVTNSKYQISEISLLQDGTTPTINQYGTIYSSGTTALINFSANIVSGNIILWATGISSSNKVTFTRVLHSI